MYSPLRYTAHILRKNRPIQFTFFVTRKCNAKCPFCFYLKKKDSPANNMPELTMAEIEKLIPSLGRLLWVAFSGGEVYLREDIVEISSAFYQQNKPTIMLYPTNGLTPRLIRDRTEEILRRCPNSTIVVKLSLDGLNGDHDALRGIPGSFKKVLETHRRLSELLGKYPNFELGINTVFCASNQERVGKILEFVKGMEHIRTHTLSMVRGDLEDESLKDVDLDKYKKAIEEMESDLKNQATGGYHFRGARLKSAQDILQRRLIHQTVSKQRRMLPCYAGQLNLVLTEHGDVYPCELLNQKLGNIKEYDYNVREMLQSNHAKQVVHDIQKNQCYCSHECYFMTNILFNPRMYPMLLKEYLQI